MNDHSTEPSHWFEVSLLVPRQGEDFYGHLLAEEMGAPVRVDVPPHLDPDRRKTHLRLRSAIPSQEKELSPELDSRLHRMRGWGSHAPLPELREIELSWRILVSSAIPKQRIWRPFRLGRIRVVASKNESNHRPEDLTILIPSTRCFGDGTHPTTRLCLRQLQRHLTPGETVLDLGCGTGLLTVACALLGAQAAVGIDTDPDSIELSRQVAGLSNPQAPCRFLLGNAESLDPLETPQADGIVANLFADLLVRSLDSIVSRLNPTGWILSSGFQLPRLDEIVEVHRRVGMLPKEIATRGPWASIFAQRICSPGP